MKLLKVFLYHQSNKVFLHLVRIIVIWVINIRLCLICLDQISPLNSYSTELVYLYKSTLDIGLYINIKIIITSSSIALISSSIRTCSVR